MFILYLLRHFLYLLLAVLEFGRNDDEGSKGPKPMRIVEADLRSPHSRDHLTFRLYSLSLDTLSLELN